MTIYIGASQAYWSTIHWDKVEEFVYRLQMRIAKAVRNRHYGKVKSLQWILTHSLYAKLLAVKKVLSSKGAKAAGIDGKLYKTNAEKLQLAKSLNQRGYKAMPLRRVYIPKSNGKKRPLGIPTLYDRAMQELYLLALEPISEMQADHNSYGFRPKRSTADAVEQAFKVLSHKSSATWVLEGDIKACFDNISHDWLLSNILIDKRMLTQWLKAGFIEKQVLFPTTEGTPQGGVISPVLANLALDGLEQVLKRIRYSRPNKIHLIRYADDFIISGATKEVLEIDVKPVVVDFLRERGLSLSEEKTTITHIDKGFDFLGFNIRKYGEKLITKPSKEAVHSFLKRTRVLIRNRKTAEAYRLIGELNPKIRGWAYYYRHIVAKEAFNYVDDCIYRCIAKWAKRRHNNKNISWISNKYFHKKGFSNWVFFGTYINSNGDKKEDNLMKARNIPIIRHVKIRKDARLYNPAFKDYFAKRKQDKKDKLYRYLQISRLNLLGMIAYDPSATAQLCR